MEIPDPLPSELLAITRAIADWAGNVCDNNPNAGFRFMLGGWANMALCGGGPLSEEHQREIEKAYATETGDTDWKCYLA